MSSPAKWVEKYLTIPFVDQGFSFDGCHCWGLVWLVYKNELNKELNKYLEFTVSSREHAATMIAESKNLDPWYRVANQKPFDVVVMSLYHRVNGKLERMDGHVGVAASNTHVLHIEEAAKIACCPDMKIPRLRHRIEGIYRHKDFIDG